MKKFAVISISLIMAATALSCGTTKLTADQQQAMQSALRNRDFSITVDRAYPQSGRSMNLTSLYSLTVKGDSVYSYLPYFGRAYNIPYGGGSGLNFNGTLKNYNVASGKQGGSVITFQSQSPDGNVEYTVEVGADGGSSILVNSQNRQSIRFSGEMKMPE